MLLQPAMALVQESNRAHTYHPPPFSPLAIFLFMSESNETPRKIGSPKWKLRTDVLNKTTNAITSAPSTHSPLRTRVREGTMVRHKSWGGVIKGSEKIEKDKHLLFLAFFYCSFLCDSEIKDCFFSLIFFPLPPPRPPTQPTVNPSNRKPSPCRLRDLYQPNITWCILCAVAGVFSSSH